MNIRFSDGIKFILGIGIENEKEGVFIFTAKTTKHILCLNIAEPSNA